jgi:hypothetical protein
MVQVGKVDMEKFAKWKLRILTKCFCRLSLLEKHWKQRITIRHNANFVWKHWIVPLINHLNVIKFYAIHVKSLKAYQLWWNENKFNEMLKYHDRSMCKSEVRSESVMGTSLSYWMMHKHLALSQICICSMLSMMGHPVHMMTFNYMFFESSTQWKHVDWTFKIGLITLLWILAKKWRPCSNVQMFIKCLNLGFRWFLLLY